MVSKIAQFRYYGKDNDENELVYNFSLYPNKQKLLIHTIPGTNLYIKSDSNSLWNYGAPFVVGKTGILEISVNETDSASALDLYDLTLARASKRIIDNSQNGYFILTLIYSEEEQEE